ncbi:3-deoxy-D-manno-octulosonic acid transferase, partial [Elusimicrobiota bacterium]
MIILYQISLFFITLLLSPFLILYILFYKGAKEGIKERFGILRKTDIDHSISRIWLHTASVGEVRILEKLPGFPFKNSFITCTTITGKNLVLKEYPGIPVFLLPVDYVFIIKAFIKKLRPEKVILIETELWPAFLYCIRKFPVYLVNARLSDKAFPRYLFFKWFLARFLKYIDFIHTIDPETKEKFLKLGVSP